MWSPSPQRRQRFKKRKKETTLVIPLRWVNWQSYPSRPCRFDSSTVVEGSAELRVGGGSLAPNYIRLKQRLTEPEQENTCILQCVSPSFRTELVEGSTAPRRSTAEQMRCSNQRGGRFSAFCLFLQSLVFVYPLHSLSTTTVFSNISAATAKSLFLGHPAKEFIIYFPFSPCKFIQPSSQEQRVVF